MRWRVETLSAPSHWSWEARAALVGVTSILVLMSAWLYLNLPVLWLPALICGFVLAVFTLRHPVFGLSVVVAAQYVPMSMGGFTIFQIAGAVVAVLCLIYWALTRHGLVFSWIMLPLVGFIFLTLHSLGHTHDTAVTQYLVRKLVLNLLFCLLLINIVDDFRKLRGLLWVLAGIGILNGVVGAFQFASGHSMEFRAKGLQENENQFGDLS
ncbi:MAG: hypothetical protein L0170_01065, partial [Acidobacteria bacterium]|nr:hypothetical protein [Acidobacteriota bacterium]